MVSGPLVYFAGAIRGSRLDAAVYAELIAGLARFSTVLTEHVADPDAFEQGMSDREIYLRDMAWLARADAVVAEVTQPSLGVGYELGRAEALGRPVLCLHRHPDPSAVSAMLTGHPGFRVVGYGEVAQAVTEVSRWLGTLPELPAGAATPAAGAGVRGGR